MRSQQPEAHICPWWFIRAFDNPLRHLFHKPDAMLRDLVHEGDRCVDLGCGIGYFTIPMARLVGPAGCVVAVDVQQRMLAGVRRRAGKAGLESRIMFQLADPAGLELEGPFDFALAFWMVHEVPDQPSFFVRVADAMKPDSLMLLVEPKAEVDERAFSETLRWAGAAGFRHVSDMQVAFSRAAILEFAAASQARASR